MDGTRKAAGCDSMRVERSKNGGFIVHHSYDNTGAGESYRMPESHVFTDHAKMIAHVGKHMAAAPAASGSERHAPTMTQSKAAGKKRGGGVD